MGFQRGVDIEMVLSNPNSIPGGLTFTEANYGNGWNCVDVAAEIIKSIQNQYSKVDDARLRAMIVDNLRICFVRHDKSATYRNGMTIGLHSKHFIVDDTCCYIGSQNLYLCDLAEWGVVVDDKEEVRRIMRDFFEPMWESSYTGHDVDVRDVMDGLKVDRDGEAKFHRRARWASSRTLSTLHMRKDARDAPRPSLRTPQPSLLMPHGTGLQYYDVEDV